MHLNARFAALCGLIASAGMLAGTAYTRDATRVINYACKNGEQFSVEYLGDHVRLRTGAGIFALSHQTAVDGEKYSDGQTVFWAHGQQASLERPGLPASGDCSPHSRSL
ncbi:MAG TPA: MliC family protein [Aromatoleum sp.]|uniref:MliC family protein n=1 Tax=Aromatoleum sp. TaxID=2307007 RepID=UPI002B45CD41|nr:MliC family protein [Aromatoleum sp.]HJV24268.1 MliC family protein [Aromatoleum sp.]